MKQFLLLLALVLSAAAQTSTDPAGSVDSSTSIKKDASALLVAQRTVAELSLSTPTDARVLGTLTQHLNGTDISGAFVLTVKDRTKVKTAFQTPSGTATRFVNDGFGVLQNADGSLRKLNGNNTVLERANVLPSLSLIADFNSSRMELLSEGTAKVNDTDCVVISLSRPIISSEAAASASRKLTKIRFFVDPLTQLILKTEYTNWPESGSLEGLKVEVFYSDYRSVSGVMVPFKQSTFWNGNPRSDLSIESVQFNVGLKDADFTLPEVSK